MDPVYNKFNTIFKSCIKGAEEKPCDFEEIDIAADEELKEFIERIIHFYEFCSSRGIETSKGKSTLNTLRDIYDKYYSLATEEQAFDSAEIDNFLDTFLITE